MANQLPSSNRQSHASRTASVCAIALFSTLAACDQTMMMGDLNPEEDLDAGAPSPVGGAGGTPTVSPGSGGTTGPILIGAVDSGVPGPGGTTGTGGVPGAGGTTGTGGQTQPGTIPAGCAPISTVPGVLNPCGHTAGVTYSPDGTLLATSRMDNANPNVIVWRLADGMPLPILPGQRNEITYDVAFSPDGKLLASAGTGSPLGPPHGGAWVRIWDIATGTLVQTLNPNTDWYAGALAFSNDGSLLATGGMTGPVDLWRVADGTKVLSIDVPSSVHNLHFSPDGTKLIVAVVDGKARVFEVATGVLVFGPFDIAGEMADAVMSPDQTQIATTWQPDSGIGGNTVRIYELSGVLKQSLSGHDAYISHVVWVDQNRIVSGDWDGTVILWERGAEGLFSLAKKWSTGGQSLGLAVSPDKTTIVTGGADSSRTKGFVFIAL